MNDTNVIPMIGGAVIDGHRVLVAKCGPDRQLPRHWELPYREMRPGETHEETLIRLFDEKFGTTIRVGRHLGKLVKGVSTCTSTFARLFPGRGRWPLNTRSCAG